MGSNCDIVKTHIKDAFDTLEQIIQSNDNFVEDIDRALKSYALDATIDRILYSSS